MLHFTNSIYRRTISRLSVKLDSWPAVQALGEELRPVQLGSQPVGGMRGGSACIPTLYKGLSPQKGPSEDRHTFDSLSHLIVWGGTHFFLWRGWVCLRDCFVPNWTRILCSIGWWSSLRCQVRVKCVVFWRCYPRRLLGEGSRRFSGITGEAQSNWLGGQWKQMWAMQQGNAFSILSGGR